jgi:hypothetical protein
MVHVSGWARPHMAAGVSALDNHRPWDSLDGADDQIGYLVAVEAAGLRGHLLTVDEAEVNMRSHHRDPLSQASH